MNSALKTFVSLCLCCLGTACSSGNFLSVFERSEPQATPRDGDEYSTAALRPYLELMDGLLEGDAVVQAETFQRVSDDALSQPTTTNRLRLAVALGTPGHSGSNAEHAQRELRELLASGELLLPEERILAAMMLAQVEQRLLLDLEAEQTQAAAADAMAQRTGALEGRLRSLQDENQSLRRELEEAQNIINEITNIERSIRERESAD